MKRFSVLSVLGLALALSVLAWVGLGLWPSNGPSALQVVVSERSAEPGGVVTVVYRFNHALSGRYNLGVTLPRGWDLVRSPDALDVVAQGLTTVFLNVRLPAQTGAGRYPITLRADGPQALQATGHIVVQSLALPRLTADVKQLQVAPGATVRLDYTLTNVGNRAGEMTFFVEAPDGWEADVLQQRLSLEPGQSARVSVQTTVSARTSMERKEVTLFASADRQASARIKVYVNPTVP